MNRIDLKKVNSTDIKIRKNKVSLNNFFTNLRHKIFGYKEGEVEELGDGVYRIHPKIDMTEMKKDIIVCLIANIIIHIIVYGVFYLIQK